VFFGVVVLGFCFFVGRVCWYGGVLWVVLFFILCGFGWGLCVLYGELILFGFWFWVVCVFCYWCGVVVGFMVVL
jgi:hypothetical protein